LNKRRRRSLPRTEQGGQAGSWRGAASPHPCSPPTWLRAKLPLLAFAASAGGRSRFARGVRVRRATRMTLASVTGAGGDLTYAVRREEDRSSKAGGGWSRDHGRWPVVDRVDDLGVCRCRARRTSGWRSAVMRIPWRPPWHDDQHRHRRAPIDACSWRRSDGPLDRRFGARDLARPGRQRRRRGSPACHQSGGSSPCSRRYSSVRAAVSHSDPDCPQNFHNSRAERV